MFNDVPNLGWEWGTVCSGCFQSIFFLETHHQRDPIPWGGGLSQKSKAVFLRNISACRGRSFSSGTGVLHANQPLFFSEIPQDNRGDPSS